MVSELGYPQEISSWLEEALSNHDGLILLVGPTGSGKTTTLYALAYLLHHRGKSVVTLEDPVERVIPGIVQVPIDIKNGFSWEQAIIAALRHDPDVLIVGEVRSLAAAQAIVQASLSGHLVITSFHGGSVAKGLARMRALGVPWELLLESLQLVIAQNLVPILCDYCKLPNSKALNSKMSSLEGCHYCSFTGYDGRSVIAEAMRCDEVAMESLRNVDSMHKVIRSLGRMRYFPWHTSEEAMNNQDQVRLVKQKNKARDI
jgi:type II secretory ATPase GspE/PulE/Tfp pilus assembly ATPase PilB-like protein